ncbi:MAG: hypothetical protein ACOYL5_11555 [Phototrophicaceae bacterium]
MTETPPALSTVVPREEDTGGEFDIMRVVYIALGVLVGLTAAIFALAVWAAVAQVEQFGSTVRVIRDIMIIFLALEGILIVLALVVLIAQIARLVNLLQSEIKPILKNTQETISYTRGTVEFVGKNLTQPVMKASEFVAATGVFMREVFNIRRVLQRPSAAPVQEVVTDDAPSAK